MNGLAGGLNIQRHLATQKTVGTQTAEHQVGIGDCCLGATFSIAGGAGLGTGRLRSNLQHAASVDPGNGTASCANGMHVDHWHCDGVVSDPALGG